MKKILPLIIVGVLVLSGIGVAAVTSNKATMDNHPPGEPFIDGEKGVIIGVEFDYYFNATDPDGDNVSYCIYWGDGTGDEWTDFYPSGEEITRSHTYNLMGAIVIAAIAKDIYGAKGPEGTYIPEWKWRNNKQSAQQSSTGSSSQNAMSVIPLSRTIINNGSLSGYVNDTSMNPIEGALVRVYFHESYEEDYSDEEGYYHVTNIPICYCLKNVSCSKECYMTEWVLLSIVANTIYDFILDTTNHPPNAPVITGLDKYGKVGVKYVFDFSSTDPDGDDIAEYIVNWGDGIPDETITGPFASGETVTVSHTWTRCGDYLISARAKDVCGFIGPEGTMSIPMTQNRQIFNPIFLQFLERFPILQNLLYLLQ